MDIAFIIFGIGAIIFLSHLFSQIFEKFNIPDVLFLVAFGFILGPVTGLVSVADLGVIGEVFVLLTLLLILFESGLDIKLKGLFSSAPRALVFILATLASTIGIIAFFGHFVFTFTFVESLLVGVLLGGVSAGISFPLLKKLPVSEETKSLITFESNINDVLTIAIVFAIIDFSNNGFIDAKSFSVDLGLDILIAFLVGSLTALLWSQLISRVRNIQNNIFMTPALVMIVFGVTEVLGASGIFAALTFGITLGNLQYVNQRFPQLHGFQEFFLTKWEKRTFEGLVFLLKTYFFVFIGLSIGVDDITILLWALGATVLLFIARMLIVQLFVSRDTRLFDIQVLQRLLPKGLVGAALITLVDNSVAQDFTFGVILWSIVFTSILIFITSRKSSVTDTLEPTNDFTNQTASVYKEKIGEPSK
jgi:NhaP-type Na+/H+ or K+/H+ antiporter